MPCRPAALALKHPDGKKRNNLRHGSVSIMRVASCTSQETKRLSGKLCGLRHVNRG